MRFTFLENFAVGRKKSTLLFIVFTSCLVTASFADVHRKLISDYGMQVESFGKESPEKVLGRHKMTVLHPRILTVKTNDYGRYDPSPALAKPPFKLIPN